MNDEQEKSCCTALRKKKEIVLEGFCEFFGDTMGKLRFNQLAALMAVPISKEVEDLQIYAPEIDADLVQGAAVGYALTSQLHQMTQQEFEDLRKLPLREQIRKCVLQCDWVHWPRK